MDTPRSLYQKIILALLAVMAVTFAILTALSRTEPGVLFEEELLSISQEGERTIYAGEVYGDAVTITTWRADKDRFVNFQREGAPLDQCQVEYTGETISSYDKTLPCIRIIKNGAVIFTGGINSGMSRSDFRLFEEDCTPWTGLVARPYSSADPWYGFSFDAGSIARFAYGPELYYQGSWGLYIIALLGTLLAALTVAFPRRIFYLQHVLSTKNPEPTEFYWAVQKIGWAIAPVLLLLCYIKALRVIV